MGSGTSSTPHNDQQSHEDMRKQKYVVVDGVDIDSGPSVIMLEWLSPHNTLGKQIIADFGSLDKFREQVDRKMKEQNSDKRKIRQCLMLYFCFQEKHGKHLCIELIDEPKDTLAMIDSPDFKDSGFGIHDSCYPTNWDDPNGKYLVTQLDIALDDTNYPESFYFNFQYFLECDYGWDQINAQFKACLHKLKDSSIDFDEERAKLVQEYVRKLDENKKQIIHRLQQKMCKDT